LHPRQTTPCEKKNGGQEFSYNLQLGGGGKGGEKESKWVLPAVFNSARTGGRKKASPEKEGGGEGGEKVLSFASTIGKNKREKKTGGKFSRINLWAQKKKREKEKKKSPPLTVHN